MKKRINYRKETIERISDIYNLNYESATSQFNRLYYRARKLYGKDRPFNVSRELYYSFIDTSKNRINAFRFNDLDLALDYKITKKEILEEDLKSLRNKISDENIIIKDKSLKKELGLRGKTLFKSDNVSSAFDKLINAYDNGKISYKQFKKIIEEYKSTAEYKSIQKEKRK